MSSSDQAVPPSPPQPPPDEKDWTWTLERRCPDCGFDAASVTRDSIARSVRDTASKWPAVLARPNAWARPAPTTWSPLEYACHVRDVHRIFKQRLELLLREDNPSFANWDQDETAIAERYWQQDPTVVAREVTDTGETLAQAYEQVGEDQWGRSGVRSNGSTFTVESLGRYLLHDLAHHVWDVRG